jgi:hypothetical protein
MAGMVMDGYCSFIEVQLQLHTHHFFATGKQASIVATILAIG